MDQTKKTMRHFYCRDVLWETFEVMANDFDCSIDYLVNESMRLYARSKNYQVPGAPSAISPGGVVGAPGHPTVTAPTIPVRPPVGSVAHAAQTAFSVTASGRPLSKTLPTSLHSSGATPPSIPSLGPGTNPGSGPGGAASANSPSLSSWSPLASASSATSNPSEPPAPAIYLIFGGQRHLVDKDQFVIGRGSKTADLAIKDGNISRKHAVVLRRNGVYYIKDLGSTNGIEYKGMRIDNKRIDEGDVFSICDYEIRFTYQA